MQKLYSQVLAPGVFTALALAVTVGAGAQTPPTAGPPSAPTSTQAAPMHGHQQHAAVTAGSETEMKADCQAMMARKQQMQERAWANDAALDELVAEMNAARGPADKERTMAAVINELVAQRKSSHAMMMERQHEMMAHMMRHMEMQATTGAVDCPLMKMGRAPGTTPGETKPGT